MGDTLTSRPGDPSSNLRGHKILLQFFSLLFCVFLAIFDPLSGIMGVKMLYLQLKLMFCYLYAKKWHVTPASHSSTL